MIQTGNPGSTLEIAFPEGTPAVGMWVYLAPRPNTLLVSIFGRDDRLLDFVMVRASVLPTGFLGIAAEEPILGVVLATSDEAADTHEAVDDISFY
jgi:hypothetical protein